LVADGPMSLKSTECRVFRLVNSDACPRPTTGGKERTRGDELPAGARLLRLEVALEAPLRRRRPRPVTGALVLQPAPLPVGVPCAVRVGGGVFTACRRRSSSATAARRSARREPGTRCRRPPAPAGARRSGRSPGPLPRRPSCRPSATSARPPPGRPARPLPPPCGPAAPSAPPRLSRRGLARGDTVT
jgi:hypothetical protein